MDKEGIRTAIRISTGEEILTELDVGDKMGTEIRNSNKYKTNRNIKMTYRDKMQQLKVITELTDRYRKGGNQKKATATIVAEMSHALAQAGQYIASLDQSKLSVRDQMQTETWIQNWAPDTVRVEG